MKRKTADAFLGILFAIGIAIMEIPTLYELSASFRQCTVIGSYRQTFQSLSAEEMENCKEKAYEYNRALQSQQQASAFSYQPADLQDSEYFSMLDQGDAEHTMALLTIPEIEVSLPVVHGTDESKLTYEAGHMYGTSLPIGGMGAHCVIAGHTGLVNARLFTDLVKLKEGDRFTVRILDETHLYAVDRILVVLPEEEERFLQIEEGKDYITLYTCTPYGVNDHRLLVRGERRDTEDADTDEIAVNKTKWSVAAKAIGLLSVPILAILRSVLLIGRKEEK